MRSQNAKAVGALHPILFFAVMYVVVLFLSIFICSSLFNSFNGPTAGSEAAETVKTAVQKESFPVQVSAAAMVR